MTKGIQALLSSLFLLLVSTALAEVLSEQSVQLTRDQIASVPVDVQLQPTYAGGYRSRRVTLVLDGGDLESAPVTAARSWEYEIRYRLAHDGSEHRLALHRDDDADAVRSLNVHELDFNGPVQLQVMAVKMLRNDVEITDSSRFPADLGLTVTLETETYQRFDPDATPALSRPAPTPAESELIQIDNPADPLPGAEEYDLEWVFIDAQDTRDGEAFALKDPVRITTADPSYRIDKHYPAGRLYLRARAVGRFPGSPESRRPGAWSDVLEIPLIAAGNADFFEPKKTWQYAATYSEGGRRREGLSYFDGTSRERQTLEPFASADVTLVSESKYDFDGSPILDILPVPTDGLSLAFRSNFNQTPGGEHYGPLQFALGQSPAPLGDQSGAGRYFSAANGLADDPLHSFVPDAEGFPFSLVQPTRDASGRPRRVSGLGKALRLHGGHDEVYYYGSAPAERLQHLFGENIGRAVQYQRDQTRDPNGQATVAYRDDADRVIATALSGEAPPMLEPILAPAARMEPHTLVTGEVDAALGRSESVNVIVNHGLTQPYFFEYELQGVGYEQALTGDGGLPKLCESCAYRLEIELLDPRGEPVTLYPGSDETNDPDCDGVGSGGGGVGGTPSTRIETSLSDQQGASQCDSGPPAPAFRPEPVRFCANLDQEGEYQVRKRLEIVPEETEVTIQEYIEGTDVFNSVVDTDSAEHRERREQACGASCEAHCERAVTALGLNQDSAEFAACLVGCSRPPSDDLLDTAARRECEEKRELMEDKMKEAGQSLDQHPEICHLGICVNPKVRVSKAYDTRMLAVQSYAEARERGFLNPLGSNAVLPQSAEGMDPYFAGLEAFGFIRRQEIVGALDQYTNSLPAWSGDPLSLWEFVADPQLTSMDCDASPKDAQWRLFRSIYLGLKQRIHALVVEEDSNCPYSDDPDALFPRPLDFTSLAQVEAAAAAALAELGAQFCPSRAEAWLAALDDVCEKLPTAADLGQIRERLTDYCTAQVDAGNPLSLLTDDALAQGDTLLQEVDDLLPQNCGLAGIAVASPLVMRRVCQHVCCVDGLPNDCVAWLSGLFARPTAVAGPTIWSGAQLRQDFPKAPKCLSQIDSLMLSAQWIAVNWSGAGSACRLFFVDEQGAMVQVGQGDRMGAAFFAADGPASATALPQLQTRYTGLAVKAVVGTTERTLFLVTDCPADRWRTDGPTCRYASPADVCKRKGRMPGSPASLDSGTAACGLDLADLSWRLPVEPTRFAPPSRGRACPAASPMQRSACSVAQRPTPCLRDFVGSLDAWLADPSAEPPSGRCFSKLSLVEDSSALALLVEYQRIGETAPTNCSLVAFDDQNINRSRSLASVIPLGGAYYTAPIATPPGGVQLPFTGFAISAGDERLYLYSDCDLFEAEDDCTEWPVPVPSLTLPALSPEAERERCEGSVDELAWQEAEIRSEQRRERFRDLFTRTHQDNCLSGDFEEGFRYRTRGREYHYTLYYYDQAGNLVQTVPPAGVDQLDTQALGAGEQPRHRLGARFWHNSLDQPTRERTPDGGEVRYWYDRHGQLRLAQDAQQALEKAVSFVRYDQQGRIVRKGTLRNRVLENLLVRIDDQTFPPDGARGIGELTRTAYDSLTQAPWCGPFAGRHLRGRVAGEFYDSGDELGATVTCYSYDPLGNIERVTRRLPGLDEPKQIRYEYDVLTGLVSASHYQEGEPEEAIHHRYRYDSDNRLIAVETSLDGQLWSRDARYSYYRHGLLARVELGEGVQGLDHLYTVQGWPKAVNSASLQSGRDPGRDGTATPDGDMVAQDVVGFALEYFPGDYRPIGAAGIAAANAPIPGKDPASGIARAACGPAPMAEPCGLYDGNVTLRTLANGKFIAAGNKSPLGFAYRYDQLYRLRDAVAFEGLDVAQNRWPGGVPLESPYSAQVAYDPNGNITRLNRQSRWPGNQAAWMDRLTYRYPTKQGELRGNRLLHINDEIPPGAFEGDLDDQGAFSAAAPNGQNYRYDAKGRLIGDRSEGLERIVWNANDLVARIDKADEEIRYLYDPSGHRAAKVSWDPNNRAILNYEYFVRDEKGSIIAVYERTFDRIAEPDAHRHLPLESGVNRARLTEAGIQGDTRLGTLSGRKQRPEAANGTQHRLLAGLKQYELQSHLDDVLATVSDRRIIRPSGPAQPIPPRARIRTALDYFPFGMPMPDRVHEDKPYRFGMKGSERDDGIKGKGRSYYTSARLYDPRVGRWLSTDPVFDAAVSAYSGFGNNPVLFNDPNGQEPKWGQLATTDEVMLEVRQVKAPTKGAAKKRLDVRLKALSSHFEANRLFERNKQGKLVDKKGSNNVQRYVYTKKSGWIDMHHFFRLGVKTREAGLLRALEYAEESEMAQELIGRKGSAFSYEDLQSDYAGAFFIKKYGKRIESGEITLEVALREYLIVDQYATDPDEAPNFDYIPHVIDPDFSLTTMSKKPLVGQELKRRHKQLFDKRSVESQKRIKDAHQQIPP